MNKKLYKLLPAVALALAASEASAQVLYEPFNYAAGAQLDSDAAGANKNYTTSGTYWATRGTQTGLFTVGSDVGAPTSTPPIPATMGGSELFPSSGTGRTPDIPFGQTFTTDGDYYYSLELKTPSGPLPTGSGTFAGFSNFSIPTPGSTGLFQAGLRYIGITGGTTYRLALAPNGGTVQDTTSKTLNAGDNVLVVARYHINSAGRKDDTVSLWINPTSGFGDNANVPAPDAFFDNATIATATTPDSVDAVTNAPMLAGFVTRSFSSTANFQFDEIRVDSTWAGVTPDGNLQYTWNDVGGGSLSDDAKWNKLAGAPAPHPDGVGHVANFGTGITSGSTINTAGEKLDTINFTNTGSLTIGGTGLTFESPASAASIYAYAGTHTISAPITMNSNLSIKTQGSGTSVTLGNTVSGAKTLGVYGTGTVNLGASDLIDDAARLEVRSGTLDLNGHSESVAAVQLGTSHPNNGVAISTGTLYNGDLASGNIGNGTLTASSYDLQSGSISATLAGTNGVVKNLSGFVTLSGNNTYTGDTVVNSGILTLAGTNSNPLSVIINKPPVVSAGTSTLSISADSNLGAAPLAPTPAVTISDSGTNLSGTLAVTEDMTLNANRTLVLNAAGSRLAVSDGKR